MAEWTHLPAEHAARGVQNVPLSLIPGPLSSYPHFRSHLLATLNLKTHSRNITFKNQKHPSKNPYGHSCGSNCSCWNEIRQTRFFSCRFVYISTSDTTTATLPTY